jgi:hypothetical protein
MKRRDFLQVTSIATIGWQFAGSVTWGQVRWEDEKETVEVALESGFRAGPMREFESEPSRKVMGDWPCVAIDAEAQCWVAHVQEDESGEQVWLRPVSPDGRFGEAKRIDAAAGVLTHLTLCAHGDGLLAAWSEKHGANWRIIAATISREGVVYRRRISPESGIAWRPAIASSNGNALVAWEHATAVGERFHIRAALLVGQQLAPDPRPSTVPGGPGDQRRPAVAVGNEGRFRLAWDEVVGPGQVAVFLVEDFRPGPTGAPVRVSQHPAANLSAAITPDSSGGTWIAFTSNRGTDAEWDIPRWIYLYRFMDGRLEAPTTPPQGMNLQKEGTDQSLEFARLYTLPDGRILMTARASHNFCLQTYGADGWSPLYRVPVDSWGGRGQFMTAAIGGDGSLWLARREFGGNVLQRLEGFVRGSQVTPPTAPSPEDRFAGKPLTHRAKPVRRWAPMKHEERGEEFQFYFGDIHGHTRMSDGLGDVDEYFYTRRDLYHDDFTSLTDHDNFVRLPIFPSGWELQKVMTQHFHRDGEFVTFFGQEYTTGRYPAGIGHKCVWTLQPDTPLWDHTRREFNTSAKLNAAARQWKAIMAPHHTGWTGTDWENADPEVQMLAEIISDHGVCEHMGNQPIPHRGGLRGGFLQDGLARGLKFGFIGSSDSHGLIWHHGAGWRRDCHRGGLACVLAEELTRESLFDAMRRRRVFATSGIKPRLDFRVNGHLMGEEFTHQEGPIRISIEIAGRERIKWVTIVRNNVDWYRYGGEGFTTRFTVTDEEILPGTSWYYARVEFTGEDGVEMAWSSPIWVTRA